MCSRSVHERSNISQKYKEYRSKILLESQQTLLVEVSAARSNSEKCYSILRPLLLFDFVALASANCTSHDLLKNLDLYCSFVRHFSFHIESHHIKYHPSEQRPETSLLLLMLYDFQVNVSPRNVKIFLGSNTWRPTIITFFVLLSMKQVTTVIHLYRNEDLRDTVIPDVNDFHQGL